MKIILEDKLDAGNYVFASVDGYQCFSDGSTYEEALKNILEAWDLHKESL